MKKFLFSVLVVLLMTAGFLYLYFMQGLFISFNETERVSVPFKAADGLYYVENHGTYEPIHVKGIHVGQAEAFHNALDFSTKKETFMDWFEDIQRLGANTIKVNTVYHQAFYDALYEFNTNSEEPLYLLQGIRPSESDALWDKDGYHPEFLDRLKRDGRKAVDVIHGRKIALNDTRTGNGLFMKDVSPWVLGFLVGDEWNLDLMAYTNENEGNPDEFTGTYIKTDGANAFEALLAKIMDDMMGYETRKYGNQRPISFVSSSIYDPFVYEESFAELIGKYNRLNIEHLNATSRNEAGLFAAYQYDGVSDTRLQHLANNEMNRALLQSGDVKSYLSLLKNHHEKPLMIVNFNVSSARNTVDHPEGVTERLQGEEIVALLERFRSSGIDHAVLHSWQDTWYLRTWNTAYGLDAQMESLWQNSLTETEHYGLAVFEPYRGETLMRVDGKKEDFEDIDFIEKEGFRYAVTRDYNYLYLFMEGKSFEKEKMVIGFDFLEDVGTKSPAGYGMTFDQGADFLLVLDGKENTELLVQERYSSIRPQFLERLKSVNPYVLKPRKDSSKMVPIQMVRRYTEEEIDLLNERPLSYYTSFTVGAFTYGQGDPDAKDYVSTSDFYFGEESVEIRIPYGLLNFYNPLDGMIHEDYYDNFGVEPLKIRKFNIGIGSLNEEIQMDTIQLSPLQRSAEVNFRLKESYGILKSYWEGSR
ncbi:hypothetical protein [Proteiniclasticum ruminis]|uniref:Uncharacterized protein n=1 Tax=Proteiniclasticum ruminis TaxID=398199 RepID=A0A1G8IB72_9CLOT|nr:hypothetical protein [Proteiniclasticum ruminis]SDI16185.1 hypothetical protein SAMN05421804_101832 [Proteiniclasticum ruminis]